MKARYLFAVAVAGVAAVVLFASLAIAAFDAPSGFTRVELESGAASIPVADLAPGRVRHFELGDTGIRFFAHKGADGVIKTAFDACKLCWAQRQGFSQRGDFMVCNSCGKQTLIGAIGEFGHDCSPISLPHARAGNEIMIETGAFLKGAQYF
jgi:uncharacterized membrane protein